MVHSTLIFKIFSHLLIKSIWPLRLANHIFKKSWNFRKYTIFVNMSKYVHKIVTFSAVVYFYIWCQLTIWKWRFFREREREALPGAKHPRGAIDVVNHPLHKENEKYTQKKNGTSHQENIRRQQNNQRGKKRMIKKNQTNEKTIYVIYTYYYFNRIYRLRSNDQ